jgi:DNA polymerase V
MHNFIASGFPSPAEDYLKPALDLNSHLISRPAATFFMRVDSIDAPKHGIFHNDILIVDRAESLSANHIVTAVVDGEMFICPFHQLKKNREVEIWGVATAVIHRL